LEGFWQGAVLVFPEGGQVDALRGVRDVFRRLAEAGCGDDERREEILREGGGRGDEERLGEKAGLHRVENAWVAEFQQGFWMDEFYPFRKRVSKICPIIFCMSLDNIEKLRFLRLSK
jgi:hypothetical protein